MSMVVVYLRKITMQVVASDGVDVTWVDGDDPGLCGGSDDYVGGRGKPCSSADV